MPINDHTTIMDANERAIYALGTGIDRLIIDRCVEAFDALMIEDDLEKYTRLMSTAIAQMNYEGPVRQQDRPTAVDRVKIRIIRAYADRWHCSYRKALWKIKKAMEGR